VIKGWADVEGLAFADELAADDPPHLGLARLRAGTGESGESGARTRPYVAFVSDALRVSLRPFCAGACGPASFLGLLRFMSFGRALALRRLLCGRTRLRSERHPDAHPNRMTDGP